MNPYDQNTISSSSSSSVINRRLLRDDTSPSSSTSSSSPPSSSSTSSVCEGCIHEYKHGSLGVLLLVFIVVALIIIIVASIWSYCRRRRRAPAFPRAINPLDQRTIALELSTKDQIIDEDQLKAIPLYKYVTSSPEIPGTSSSSSSSLPPLPSSFVIDNCAICLEEYVSGDCIRVLPKCEHLFHKDCIDRWLLERSTNCPICRDRVIDEQDVHQCAESGRNTEGSNAGPSETQISHRSIGGFRHSLRGFALRYLSVT